VRAVFPFYAWYKAIAKIVFKLPLDYPGRATCSRSSTRSASRTARPARPAAVVPAKGAIPLGGDELLKTQGLNPLATIPQLARRDRRPRSRPGARTNDARRRS
jgi:hypothetical protein